MAARKKPAGKVDAAVFPVDPTANDKAWYDVQSEALARAGRKPSRRRRFKVTQLEPGIPAGSGLRGRRRRHVRRFLEGS